MQSNTSVLELSKDSDGNLFVNVGREFNCYLSLALGDYPLDPAIKKLFVGKVMDTLSSSHIQKPIKSNKNIEEDSIEDDRDVLGNKIIISGDDSGVLKSLSYYGESLVATYNRIFNEHKNKIENYSRKPKYDRKLIFSLAKEIANSLNSGVGLRDFSKEVENAICFSFDTIITTAAEIGYHKNKAADYEEALAVGVTELVDPDLSIGSIKVRDAVEAGVSRYANFHGNRKRLEEEEINNIINTMTSHLGKWIVYSGEPETVVSSLSQFRANISSAYDALAKDSGSRIPMDLNLKYHIQRIEKGDPYQGTGKFEGFLRLVINTLANDAVWNCYTTHTNAKI